MTLVIPSGARNLALKTRDLRDSSSSRACRTPQNDRPEGFFRSLLIFTAAMALLWTEGVMGFAAVALPGEAVSAQATAQVSESSTPEVASVDPPRAAPKSEATLKIEGKNFAQGAKVSLSNPGIRVLETTVSTRKAIH